VRGAVQAAPLVCTQTAGANIGTWPERTGHLDLQPIEG